MTATPPASPQPTSDDLAAVSDLTTLAAELHRRGYTSLARPGNTRDPRPPAPHPLQEPT